MKKYDFKTIETKWQKRWAETNLYEVDIASAKKPFYNLMMFPYPSAEGLHIGHFFSFGGIDAFGRYKRMQGYDVFQPIGLDAFGINSENYALKTNTHPQTLAERTEKNFYRQLHATGNGYTWSHTLETNKPDYYKWTQWLFVVLYNNGLVEKKKAPVNWCPSCLTVLSDEQVIAGKCERCSSEVEVKELEQWFFKITKYAERLLKNLETINWDPQVTAMQRNWIGKKEGAEITFDIKGTKESITVFTTRPDTIYGVTAIILGPEHPLAESIATDEFRNDVKEYIKQTKNKNETDRVKQGREKTGVATGAFAIHPLTNQLLPLYIADYVIGSVGTGAIMAVPAHDQRDFDFAKKYNLPVINVIQKYQNSAIEKQSKDNGAAFDEEEAYEDYGFLINSAEYNGLHSENAREKIIKALESREKGKKKITYHLRDWLISRQRYWGPPIPIIYCDKCGIQPVKEDQLPVLLPYIEDFRPTGTGKSPLASYPEFYETTCPECGGNATRETDVSDTFLDSSWYFLRYPSVFDNLAAFDPKKTKHWLPVSSYIGGKEHSVLHLLYSRFMTMVLHDLGYLPFEEPFAQFRAHGLIIKDGAKMSKSRGNVINPDEYVEKYGIDTVRLYLAFVGPFNIGGDFRDSGINGMQRFIQRVWQFVLEKNEGASNKAEKRVLANTILRVANDLDELHFNTAVAAIMELLNQLTSQERVSKDAKRVLVQLLAPFAPHMTEELWQLLGEPYSVHTSTWPSYNKEDLVDETELIVVQINGKTRAKLIAPRNATKEQVLTIAQTDEKVIRYVTNFTEAKVIFIPGKLINFVITKY